VFGNEGDVQQFEERLFGGLVEDEDVDGKKEPVGHVALVEGRQALDETAEEVLEGDGGRQVGDGRAGSVHQSVVQHFKQILFGIFQGKSAHEDFSAKTRNSFVTHEQKLTEETGSYVLAHVDFVFELTDDGVGVLAGMLGLVKGQLDEEDKGFLELQTFGAEEVNVPTQVFGMLFADESHGVNVSLELLVAPLVRLSVPHLYPLPFTLKSQRIGLITRLKPYFLVLGSLGLWMWS